MGRAHIALILVFAASCGEPAVDAPAPPPPPAPPGRDVAPATPPTLPPPAPPGCDRLSRRECLDSPRCTLVATEASDTYLCRDAVGPCEIGLTTSQESQDRCQDFGSACLWEEGTCYCGCRDSGRTAVPDREDTPYCDCACGGGPPPGCRAR